MTKDETRDDTDALKDLLAKVEGGHAVAKDFENVWGTACQDMALQEIHRNAFYAYKGSFDAAKALHETLLSNFDWVVTAQGVDVWDKSYHPHPAPLPYSAGNSTPARAWLIAILRALIAERGE